MARIIIFTYDTRLDRRALLECESLQAHGHTVTLYAPAYADESADPAYVVRINHLVADTKNAATTPTLYARALAAKRWLLSSHPRLVRLAMPVIRPLFWQLLPLLNAVYSSCGGRKKQDCRHGAAAIFLDLFAPVLSLPLDADLYIAHDLPMLPVALEAKRRYGGKVLYDSHELFPEQGFGKTETRVWKALETEQIHHADSIVTINPSIARHMQHIYGLAHVDVIYNADRLPSTLPVRGTLFHQRLGLPAQARILLYQGNFSLERNLDILVRMMTYVADPSLHLVFLGNGPAGDMLARQVRLLSLEGRVHFLDTVPQAELIAYTASADLGLIPYQDICLNNRYCTPNKLFEFVIAGLPAVATNLPEISHLYSEFGIGITGDTSDPEALASLVREALEPARWQALHHATLAAREVLNWQHEGEKFVQIVEATLQPSPAEQGRVA